jgi:large subunit ribosomal protein L34e
MLRYNTVSNKVRVIRTPGGEHRYLHIKKRGTSPKCGDCGVKLPGVCRPQLEKEKA